jgi:hypothetical protein
MNIGRINLILVLIKKFFIVCVGYRKREWDTLLEVYDKANTREDFEYP